MTVFVHLSLQLPNVSGEENPSLLTIDKRSNDLACSNTNIYKPLTVTE